MVSKRRYSQLSQARANGVYQPVKKPQIATITEENQDHSFDVNEELEEPSWYWNNSSDDELTLNISGGMVRIMHAWCVITHLMDSENMCLKLWHMFKTQPF